MSLSSIIDRAIDLNTALGITHQPRAKATAVPLIYADAGALREAVDIITVKLIRDQATRAMRKVVRDKRQGSFWTDRLRERYALDNDTKVIKDLDCLSRMEFTRIVALRNKQLADDTFHTEALNAANGALAPIWDEYPDKLFGEVERIYLARQRDVA
jgi:hypothetical protein